MSIIYEPKGRALEYSLLACNIYNGCSHMCNYCYAKPMMERYGKDFSQVSVKKNFLKQLENDAKKYAGTNKRVLLSFTCDPYQKIDIKEHMTRQAIIILKEYNIPFQILTKGGMRAVGDFDFYDENDAFATTLTFDNRGDSLRYEPQAAEPENRIRAIKLAHDMGIDTWVSLEPVLDPIQSLNLIIMTHEFINLYKIGKLNHRKSDIDWRDFGVKALELCRKLGKKYYIKHDLAEYLKDVKFINTDTRIVNKESYEATKDSQVR